MSIQVIYTDLADNAITEQQLARSMDFKKSSFQKGELREVEFWSFSYIKDKVVQSGGIYYLAPNDDLNIVKQNIIGKGDDWTLYYNKIGNAAGDALWDYQILEKGLLKSRGKECFDSQMREISNTVFSDEMDKYVAKRKYFYGDPAVFPPPYKGCPTYTFYYNHGGDPVEVIRQYGAETEFDYSVREFLANEQEMSVFSWDQHTYFHSFEPMLP